MGRQAKPRSDVLALVDRVVRDIQSGALAPGMWLKQIDLEQRYGRSRPDVRRALDHLVQKRLVRHVPNRGYHVYEPDSAQTDEVRDIRLILEQGVADRIVANATPADIEALRMLAGAFDALSIRGTILELYETNLQFHRRLLGLCGNSELTNLVSELRQRTSSAPASQWSTRARVELSGREHHEMIEAIAQKNAARLRDVIDRHIRQPETTKESAA